MMDQSDLQAALHALNQGNYKSALKQARIGIKRHRKSPEFPNIAGIAASSLGKRRDAVGFFQQALKLAPDFHDARANLAQTLILMGQNDTAVKVTARLLKAQPGNAKAVYLHVQALLGDDRPDEALQTIETALAADPGQLRLLNLKAQCQTAMHRPEEALETLSAALPLAADPVPVMMEQCRLLHELQRFDEAHALCNRILEAAPDHHDALFLNATQLSQAGQTQAALEICGRMLDADPLDTDALGLASSLARGEQALALRPALEQAFAAADDPATQVKLSFALARTAVAPDSRETAQSWYARANALQARATPYDARADQKLFDRIRALSAGLAAADPQQITDAATPIFVIGQPRSGTTLMERVLDASPKAEGLGELTFLSQLITPALNTPKAVFGSSETAALNDAYRRMVRPIAPAQGFFVDKMPENYLFAGIMLAAFPGSRIIHMVRDPRDVALSMWQQDFGDTALTYTFDLKAMAQRANLYRALMNHWHAQFPGRILDVAYQDLVTDLEATSRAACGYCGLDWVPQMLSPEKNAKAVQTASVTSVFSAVNASSVGKWKAHADTLAPFIQGLDPALWPELDL